MNENVRAVLEAFSQKSSIALTKVQDNKALAYKTDPEIEKTDKLIQSTALKIFTAALEGGNYEEKVEKINAEHKMLTERLKELLKKNGFEEDFLNIKYECNKCSDTGYIGLNMCKCLKDAIRSAEYESSGLGQLSKRQNFDNFSLSVYPEKSYSVMENIYNYTKKYAETFSASSSSLLFIGKTGLGKTHISSAIGKIAIDKGYFVIYESAPSILYAFEKDRFSNDQSGLFDKYYDCDLLIIDDLGTERATKLSQTWLYTLINTRLVKGRPTIINTNLDHKMLENTYDSPVVSRLFGEFVVLLFEGNDIRRQKI